MGADNDLTQESPVYNFPEGIPAFESHDRFKLIRDPKLDPFLFLVSQIDQTLRFICVQIRFLVPHYTFELDSASASLLEVQPGTCSVSDERFACLAILSFPPGEPATANLMAPVVINLVSGVGVQAVQSSTAWSHAEPVGIQENQRCS